MCCPVWLTLFDTPDMTKGEWGPRRRPFAMCHTRRFPARSRRFFCAGYLALWRRVRRWHGGAPQCWVWATNAAARADCTGPFGCGGPPSPDGHTVHADSSWRPRKGGRHATTVASNRLVPTKGITCISSAHLAATLVDKRPSARRAKSADSRSGPLPPSPDASVTHTINCRHHHPP